MKTDFFKPTAEFLQHQVEALQKELQRKNVELDEKNELLRYYDQQLCARIEKPVQKITDRYPACYEPLPNHKLS